MFSALKKLTHRSPEALSAVPNHGASSMNIELQKKFARGVNYNLKMILKGDRNTGKSCLLKRLQGGEFTEEYVPTDEIQVASIPWSYKATDDIVKVEVWDVVDKGKKRKKMEGLKLGSSSSQPEESFEPALDAEFVDVYKGTHCVVFLFDVTKLWTFEYVEKELPKVPSHIPVLVLANFIDKQHHRVVTKEQALSFVEFFDRGPPQNGKDVAEIRYAESSMRNGFGLRLLHKFINLPFLILQRESLIVHLETNKREIHITQDELNAYLDSPEAQYETFLNQLTQRRRNVAESLAPAPTVDVVVGQPSHMIKTPSPKPDPKSEPKANDRLETSHLNLPVSPRQKSETPSEKSSIGSTDKSEIVMPTSIESKSGKVDVDSFVPDQLNSIDNFLDDDTGVPSNQGLSTNIDEDDDDEESCRTNPMVSGFIDELDVEDLKMSTSTHLSVDNNADTSSESEMTNSKPTENESEARKLKVKSSGDNVNLFQVPELTPRSLSPEVEEKKKKHKKKKSKKRSSKSPSRERDDLEDFLNGDQDASHPPDAAIYEAL